MDFNDTPEDAVFRTEVREWLSGHFPPRQSNAPRPKLQKGDNQGLSSARAWQRKKAIAGYASVPWPPEWGGRNGSPMQEVIFRAEEATFDVPDNVFAIGLGMCIPTLIHHGSPEIVERFVGPATHGDEIWCQLFSEPSGGSDLASLRTKAEREGSIWRVNGQKIWTSRAHLADYGLLLARTDPQVPKHKGLTMFWIDMRAPGVDVRPIRQMSGESEFSEVFFTDLMIDDKHRIGEVGAGWKVAVSTLSQERLAVGIGEEAGNVTDLTSFASAVGVLTDTLRAKIAYWYAREQGMRHTVNRTLTAVGRGEKIGPEASIVKLVSASQRQEIAGEALDLLGGTGIADGRPTKEQDFQYLYLWSPAARIAGGSDEILRNIIAERVLGLPAENQPDRGLPFALAVRARE